MTKERAALERWRDVPTGETRTVRSGTRFRRVDSELVNFRGELYARVVYETDVAPQVIDGRQFDGVKAGSRGLIEASAPTDSCVDYTKWEKK